MQKNIALGLALALSVAFTAASKKVEAGSFKEFKTHLKPLAAKESEILKFKVA